MRAIESTLGEMRIERKWLMYRMIRAYWRFYRRAVTGAGGS
jgi:hypothetical protein